MFNATEMRRPTSTVLLLLLQYHDFVFRPALYRPSVASFPSPRRISYSGSEGIVSKLLHQFTAGLLEKFNTYQSSELRD